MAQTISELEKERAELLRAIENQAQHISNNRNSEDDLEGHSLKDWLNAAEEVMPTKPAPGKNKGQNSAYSSSSSSSKTSSTNGKASFFGVIILLSLLLTILGVLYIAYNTINKELQEVKEVKETSQTETFQLQESMNKLQQSVATGGTPERFVELEQRVLELEAQLETIKKQQIALLAKLEVQATTKDNHVSETTTKDIHASIAAMDKVVGPDKVVTESILDEKLKSYTTGLEQRIDEKLEAILQYLTKGEIKPELKDKVLLNGASDSQANHTVSGPEEPKVSMPRIEQPIVKMVESVQKPDEPAVAKPVAEYSEDVKWLLEQPAQHYVLQLASMTDKQALVNMVRQKGLVDTRIVVQKRDDSLRYVLVHGSYANKKDANLKSKEIKGQFGISPWVRKMKDLSSKLP